MEPYAKTNSRNGSKESIMNKNDKRMKRSSSHGNDLNKTATTTTTTTIGTASNPRKVTGQGLLSKLASLASGVTKSNSNNNTPSATPTDSPLATSPRRVVRLDAQAQIDSQTSPMTPRTRQHASRSAPTSPRNLMTTSSPDISMASASSTTSSASSASLIHNTKLTTPTPIVLDAYESPQRRVPSKTNEARRLAQAQPQPQPPNVRFNQEVLLPKNGVPITSLNIACALETLKKEQDHQKLSQQQQPSKALPPKLTIKTTSNRQLIQFFNRARNDEDVEAMVDGDDASDDSCGSSTGHSSDDDDDDYYSESELSEMSEMSEMAETIRLGEQECLELYRKLGLFKNDEKQPNPEFKRGLPMRRVSRRANIVLSPRNKIYEASIKAYKVWDNGIVNFHGCREYEQLKLCYVAGCNMKDQTIRYIKNITLTELRAHYAGFDECAIYRIIKFCPACFQIYLREQTKRPDDPLLVKINKEGYLLFSPLNHQ